VNNVLRPSLNCTKVARVCNVASLGAPGRTRTCDHKIRSYDKGVRHCSLIVLIPVVHQRHSTQTHVGEHGRKSAYFGAGLGTGLGTAPGRSWAVDRPGHDDVDLRIEGTQHADGRVERTIVLDAGRFDELTIA
jgi:hypothetical protein